MSDPTTLRLLNRAAAVLRDGLPRYLTLCPPVAVRGDGAARGLLRTAGDDYEHHLRVVEDLLEANHGVVQRSTFPVEYTALNDLTIRYLIDRLAEASERDAALLGTIGRQLPLGTVEQSQVEAATRSVRLHAQSWQSQRNRSPG